MNCPNVGRGIWPDLCAPSVNWLLMAAIARACRHLSNFREPGGRLWDRVSADMVLTTFLLSIALREIWELPLPAAIAIGVGFGTVEGSLPSPPIC